MKKIAFLLVFVVTVFSVLFFTACKKEVSTPDPPTSNNGFSSLQVPENFTWATSVPLNIDLTFVNQQQDSVVTTFEVVSKFPDGVKFMNGTSKSDGTFNKVYQIAMHRTSFFVLLLDQSPVEVVFGETQINGYNAREAKATIVVENPALKAVTDITYEYYPAEGKYGTICFEDNWPSAADYDFNDVVIDYNVKATFNDDYKVTQINMQLFLRASGANNHNGFGISFNHSWSNDGDPYPDISTVTVNGETVSAEATNYPSYILIQDIEAVQPTYNTIMNNDFVEPTEFNVEIIFNTPAENWWELNFPLQNPFIFIAQDRGREVHLPYYIPTSLANPDLARTGVDFSDLEAFNPENFKAGNVVGFYTYMTEQGYPWALDIYMDNEEDNLFLYPIEFADITGAYSSFEGWVEEYDPFDWYLPEYRVEDSVYTKIPNPPYTVE